MTKEEIVHDKAVAAAQALLTHYAQEFPNKLQGDEAYKQFESYYKSAYDYFEKI